MKSLRDAVHGAAPLGRRSRQALRVSDESLVKVAPLEEGRAIPWLIEPAAEGVDLVSWAGGHRGQIEDLLLEHRALLFRGFGVDSVEALERFVAATSDGPPLEYRDRSTPRHTVGDKVYVSTIYPADETIHQHNEGTYWRTWPRKIYFCCLTAPEVGGETPIADVRGVLRRIEPEVRRRFAERGVLYQRNYNDGFGLTWQDAYQTDDPAEVTAYCRDHDIRLEWKDDGRLRTRQVRPAIRRHPVTGEELWFNHAAFFHVSSLEPEAREALVADLGEDELPYNTYYGDGSRIEDEVVEGLRGAYAEETYSFPWREGDVMLLDNMTITHGRRPYRGDRNVIVAMTEAVSEG